MTQCHDSSSNPADAGCNSDNAQYSSTPARNASRSDAGGPSLRSPGFEDEDEDEDSGSTELAEVLPDIAFGAHGLASLAVSEVGTTKDEDD